MITNSKELADLRRLSYLIVVILLLCAGALLLLQVPLPLPVRLGVAAIDVIAALVIYVFYRQKAAEFATQDARLARDILTGSAGDNRKGQ
jgi:hypothetical protein